MADGTLRYDAIVVGARCAGSPTAMLLARKGYRVLAVDRATFPERHHLDPPHPPARRRRAQAMGPARPRRRDRLPADRHLCVRFRPVHARGSTGDATESAVAYAPRRTVLDKTPRRRGLRSRSRSAGGIHRRRSRSRRRARHRHSRTTAADGRRSPSRRASSIGADGLHSMVARAVTRSSTTRSRRCWPATTPTGAGCPMNGRFEVYVRAVPLFRGVADERRPDARHRAAGRTRSSRRTRRTSKATISRCSTCVPSFAERIRGARREERFAGMAVPNYFRKPFGPGWALVGDAGYNKDFITAQGIQDAFRDAELCVAALDEAFSGARAFDAAMADYQSTRDAHVLPMYEFTASSRRTSLRRPRCSSLLAAMHGNQDAMDGFARVNAGVDVARGVLLRGERPAHLRGGKNQRALLVFWKCPLRIGGPSRTRTSDPLIKSRSPKRTRKHSKDPRPKNSDASA